jgi:hypothetical protein
LRGVGFGHDLVLPLIRASLLLETDGVTLSDATYLFYTIYYLMRHDHLASKIVELSWAQHDNHLFIISFCLDPKYMEVTNKIIER